MHKGDRWQALAEKSIQLLKSNFFELYPDDRKLAEEIGNYWLARLTEVWKKKPDELKQKDIYHGNNPPLPDKTILIAYPDSLRHANRPGIDVLLGFLQTYFPRIKGLDLLPACELCWDRFNDSGYSQKNRTRIDPRFGSNESFEKLVTEFQSQAEFVPNHVDREHEMFQKFLALDDEAGKCFYLFDRGEYLSMRDAGAFASIHRPRAFPLFIIVRRKRREKGRSMNELFKEKGLHPLPDRLLAMLGIFNMVANRQGLLPDEENIVRDYIEFLRQREIDQALIFCPSELYPGQKKFQVVITSVAGLLNASGFKEKAYAEIFENNHDSVYGEEYHVLTTYSHVQVDVNTSTFAGIKLLIDDLCWYLGMDFSLLRLDAANYMFKKWGSSCFGLKEVELLKNIIRLSCSLVAPRIKINAAVCAPLREILHQFSLQGSPDVMYEFSMPILFPLMFNNGDATLAKRIADIYKEHGVPEGKGLLCLPNGHDGRNFQASNDLLSYSERHRQIEIAQSNGGKLTYKCVPTREYSKKEFKKICQEARIDFENSLAALFKEKSQSHDRIFLKEDIINHEDMAGKLTISTVQLQKIPALKYFAMAVLEGQAVYELCCSTRDTMHELKDEEQEIKRYLAFYTLAFAFAPAKINAIYFPDLFGLKNDRNSFKKTGEARSLNRQKMELTELTHLLENPNSFEARVARNMADLINIYDSDPAFTPPAAWNYFVVQDAIAVVTSTFQNAYSLVMVNVSSTETIKNSLDVTIYGGKPGPYQDRLDGKHYDFSTPQKLLFTPNRRYWFTQPNKKSSN
ncbi:alpha-amylase family glycosyl hydrolase [Candidatus Riflebacteria bacterium]